MNQHTALRAVDSVPTYEQVIAGPGRKTGLSDALRALRPGDVLDVTDLTNAYAKSHAIRATADALFGRGAVATRTIDGRIFAARLYPRDTRANGGAR